LNGPKRVSVFVDESGRGRPDNRHNENQPYFIVGVLVTDRSAYLTHLVNEVCEEENFRRELHWREFNRTSSRVYCRVVERLNHEDGWEYKATRFKAERIDFRFFGAEHPKSKPVEREHYVYNFFVKEGIAAALRYSHICEAADELEIIVDEKARTREDNFLEYIRRTFAEQKPGLKVIVRDCPSETERLVQVCDIISGTHNTLLVRAAGATKITAAERIWGHRCQQYEYKLRAFGG